MLRQNSATDVVFLGLMVQICLAYGLFGILWPEKLKECTILWFPFLPTQKTVRNLGVVSLAVSGMLFALLLNRL